MRRGNHPELSPGALQPEGRGALLKARGSAPLATEGAGATDGVVARVRARSIAASYGDGSYLPEEGSVGPPPATGDAARPGRDSEGAGNAESPYCLAALRS